MGYPELWDELEERVHRGPGALKPHERAGAHDAANAPSVARGLVEKLHGDAASIEDADVAALSTLGWNEDQIFEFLVSGSVAAARTRLDAALTALHHSKRDSKED
jgi:alkylhydroperoxidase family enzyme